MAEGFPKNGAAVTPDPGSHFSRNDFGQWPAPLRGLCRSHGEAAVYSTGQTALGYPPTWAATATEFRKVQQALELNQKEKA